MTRASEQFKDSRVSVVPALRDCQMVARMAPSSKKPWSEEHRVDVALGIRDGAGGLRDHRVRQLLRGRHQLVRLLDAINHAEREQFGRGVPAAQKYRLLGAPGTQSR